MKRKRYNPSSLPTVTTTKVFKQIRRKLIGILSKLPRVTFGSVQASPEIHMLPLRLGILA